MFRGTERSVEMPVVPSFMTCDLCDFLGDGLTLPLPRKGQFFDAQHGTFRHHSCSVLAACRCKLLVAVRNSKILPRFTVLEVDLMKLINL